MATITSPKLEGCATGGKINVIKLKINKIIPHIPNKSEEVDFKFIFILWEYTRLSTFQSLWAIFPYKELFFVFLNLCQHLNPSNLDHR